ncbi:MAG: class 1 fructose-bisphosphatase [Oligoflexia bacterium]|nr:class 1 fructose-bisphosphatase [Oligoflexia bacterium]
MIPTQTLQRFIHSKQRQHSASTGELTDLLTAISLGVKMISRLVSTAGLKGLYGYSGVTNVQGEAQQILDQEADEILVQLLGSSGHFGSLVSEERDTVISSDQEAQLGLGRKYVVAFDPLDGSSNLGSNIPVGTIFCIFEKPNHGRKASNQDFLQSGKNIVAAGYAVYGAKTSFIYSSGDGVHGFIFDPSLGEFLLTEPELRMPERGSLYSVNEGNYHRWDKRMQRFVDTLKLTDKQAGTPYSSRYVGSLVADFDRNLKKGGVFLYPADNKNEQGKLRLLYECMPLAFIAEQAGGRAIDGQRNILDIVPQNIHERSPLIIGSKYEVDWYQSFKAD